MTDESKAIQEVAKTTTRALDVAQATGSFIAKLINGTLEQGIGIFEDKLRYVRWERQVRLMKRADDYLKALGMKGPSRAVQLKIAVPLLQAALLEENDDLQDRWAILLVNAANCDFKHEILRSYISILEQISPFEARIMDEIYSLPFSEMRHKGVRTLDLPTAASVFSEEDKNNDEPNEDVLLALGNLARLGCIKPSATWGGGEIYCKIHPTILGKSFIRAIGIARGDIPS